MTARERLRRRSGATGPWAAFLKAKTTLFPSVGRERAYVARKTANERSEDKNRCHVLGSIRGST